MPGEHHDGVVLKSVSPLNQPEPNLKPTPSADGGAMGIMGETLPAGETDCDTGAASHVQSRVCHVNVLAQFPHSNRMLTAAH